MSPESPCPQRDAIVLAIDGLRCAELGPYGGATRDTPAINRLASQAAVADWALAGLEDGRSLYRSGVPLGDAWPRKLLVTDTAEIARLPAFEPFDEATVVADQKPVTPAETLDDTAMAAVFAALGDTLGNTLAADELDASPRLLWLHTHGLLHAWDAPHDRVIEGLGEDDLWPLPSVALPSGRVARAEDPDAVFEATWRYAAQVSVLDRCVGGLLAVIEAAYPADRRPLIVLVGLRGFALGEHDTFGLPEAGPYAESRHVPMLIAQPGLPPGVRFDGLIDTHQLPRLLAPLAIGVGAEAVLADAARELVVLRGRGGDAVRTADWMLRSRRIRPSDSDSTAVDCVDELYAKPDDRWEANDVASLEPRQVESLRAHLTDPDS